MPFRVKNQFSMLGVNVPPHSTYQPEAQSGAAVKQSVPSPLKSVTLQVKLFSGVKVCSGEIAL